MVYLIALLLATLVSIQARTFHNPILSDKSYNLPSTIKVNGTYYVVAHADDTSKGIYPIHSSTDLMEWKSAGYVFDERNTPAWANNQTFYNSYVHQIEPFFLFYFTAFTATGRYYEVGVAIAENILGPYSSIDRPILSYPNADIRFPSVINDEDKLYLAWTSNRSEIEARQLNPHGLTFSSEQAISLLKPTLAWENGFVYAPWYIRRNNYHYIFYSGYWSCGNSSIGVARSSNALGPYEKLSEPIIVSNINYTCTEYESVVKDLDDENDLIYFKAYPTGHPELPRSIFLTTLTWDADEWPYAGEF